MKLQFIALSFVVIGCFQLLDVDGSKKAGSVSIDCIYVSVHTLFVTRHIILTILMPFVIEQQNTSSLSLII